VIGAGHVGAVYAAGLAELGNSVTLIDVDKIKVRSLSRGSLWFYEPGLTDLFKRGLADRRLKATSSFSVGLKNAEFVFICVPTPTTQDGSLDDSMLRSAFQSVRDHAPAPAPIIVNKSTVPVGTGEAMKALFHGVRVVSSPEFLAEGRALQDFFQPSRIVIGASDLAAGEAVAALFSRIKAPFIFTDHVSAEFSKLASNAFLATKISFANALSGLTEPIGADLDAVAQVLGADPRIGAAHLVAGLGFGGSCLPKDVAALEHLARRSSAPYDLFAAVAAINRNQIVRVIDFLVASLGSVESKRIAIFGGSFKPHTDDIRESPALRLAESLSALHADVVIYDPVAAANVRRQGFKTVSQSITAARGAYAVVIATEWPEFAATDLVRLKRVMKRPLLVDGRGVFAPARALDAGFELFSFGRRTSPVPKLESSRARRAR
jgi:UDPglucose 6-dehydrogenase